MAPLDANSDIVAEGLSVRRLTLTDFRCYHHLRMTLDARPVVLTGANGAGKTNLLEGLSFLVPGRGLRRAKLSDIMRRERGENIDAPQTPIRPWGVAATLSTPDGEVEIGTAFEKTAHANRDKRIVKVDGEVAKSQAILSDHVSALWLTPLMDRLFIEGPDARRRFLDRLVFDSDPAHAGRVKAYDHAMRERLRLLRDGSKDADWLASLEDTMATRGVAVAAARLDVARRLSVQLAANTGAFPGAEVEVAGSVESWLGDGPALAAEDRFRAALARARGRDAGEGRTTIGPHKSELQVRHLGNGQAAQRCSTGEQKALLIALVLGFARMRAQERGYAPMLLLDEIAAHLDSRRLNALLDEILGLGAQVWMTGTDSDLFKPLAGRAQFFNVAEAAVTAVR
ncbi:MAG: DNA replication/repair protein RecF [Proteobacteria bacterium]|nr:DNA replication/repair protein RecF [Pseudomonadota bacterium]